RRLKCLEVMDLDRDVLPELKQSARIQATLFSCARKLALYPENRETLDLCGYFVEKTAGVLEELIIHANFDAHDAQDHGPPSTNGTALDLRAMNDTATGPGLLCRTVFGHMLPFETCTPFQHLTSLRLHRVSLRHCAETWCRFVDFTRMQHLRLYQCLGADTLLGQLGKAAHLPKQLKLLEFQHKDNAENEALVALDGLLCLVSGLRELTIDMENLKALPAAAGIARHGKTLETLNVHGSAETNVNLMTGTEAEELVWEPDEFARICKACPRLEQLSCAWPPSSLIRAPTEAWRGYESAIMGNLRRLITLHISVFPNNKPSTQLLPKAIYEQLLQCLATRIFDLPLDHPAKTGAAVGLTSTTHTAPSSPPDPATPTPNPLRLLAFGIHDKIYEREDSRTQLLYLRSSALSALGAPQVHAAPIGWCMRQYVEPRSGVLEFVMERGTRVPCKERDGGGEGGGGGLGGHGGWGSGGEEGDE
ncbi:hypothetical protein LTR53_013583, partial [Teratosphaeriaceae sp. CCFEE 6253]